MQPGFAPVEIRQLTKADLRIFQSLVELFELVFEEPVRAARSDAHSFKLLGDPRFVAIVAIIENKVIGGLTAYELPMVYSESSEILLYDLAVKPAYQRMGVGKKLIQALKAYCVRNGIKTFFVLAAEEDEHAVEFYRATGGKSEKVVNFIYEMFEE